MAKLTVRNCTFQIASLDSARAIVYTCWAISSPCFHQPNFSNVISRIMAKIWSRHRINQFFFYNGHFDQDRFSIKRKKYNGTTSRNDLKSFQWQMNSVDLTIFSKDSSKFPVIECFCDVIFREAFPHPTNQIR